jgi:hypothetical protein
MSDDRIKEAFNAFTSGIRPGYTPLPTWDTAPAWVRDAMRVAYLQGKLDSGSQSPAVGNSK